MFIRKNLLTERVAGPSGGDLGVPFTFTFTFTERDARPSGGDLGVPRETENILETHCSTILDCFKMTICK